MSGCVLKAIEEAEGDPAAVEAELFNAILLATQVAQSSGCDWAAAAGAAFTVAEEIAFTNGCTPDSFREFLEKAAADCDDYFLALQVEQAEGATKQ